MTPCRPLPDLPETFRRRVAIDRILPDVDGGRFAAKRIVDQPVTIAADIVCDGHDELECRLHVRPAGTDRWTSLPMSCEGNDRWQASFTPGRIGPWEYTVSGRVDHFASWRRDLALRAEAGEDLAGELAEGRLLIEAAAARSAAGDAAELTVFAAALTPKTWRQTVADDRLLALLSRHADRAFETWLDRPRPL